MANEPDEALRRLILTEYRNGPGLADLIRAENCQADPPQAALPPAPGQAPLSILDQLHKEVQ